MQPPSRILSLWVRWRTYALPIMALLAFAIPGINQGWPTTDSHRYSAVALHIVESGEWIYPFLGDLPYFNKPMLTFWIHAAVFKLLSVEPGNFDIWAMRVPVILSAIVCLILTVNIVRRLGAGPRLAMLTGLVLATTLEFFRYTRAFSLDIWLTMWMLLLIWCVLNATLATRPASHAWIGWMLLAGFATGCALMTKPFMVLMPITILFIWILIDRRPRALLALLAALILGILLALPWHIAMAFHWGEPFTHNYLITESLDRVQGRFEDPSPWWRYLRTLGKWYWPWMLGLAGFLVMFARRRHLPTHTIRIILFSTLWVAFWLIALSATGDKRGRYIVPIYPFLSVFSAVFLAYALPTRMRRNGRVPMLWLGPSMLGVGIALSLMPIQWHKSSNNHWVNIVAWMDEHAPDEQLWTIERHNTSGVHYYLLTGDKVRLIGPTRHGYGSTPPDNAYIYFVSHTLPFYQELGDVVFTAGENNILRLDGPWRWPENLPDRLPTAADDD